VAIDDAETGEQQRRIAIQCRLQRPRHFAASRSCHVATTPLASAWARNRCRFFGSFGVVATISLPAIAGGIAVVAGNSGTSACLPLDAHLRHQAAGA